MARDAERDAANAIKPQYPAAPQWYRRAAARVLASDLHENMSATITIPAGTTPKRCRSCKAEVYWVDGPNGKRVIVSAAVGVGGLPPTDTEPGHGVSHFADCPQAAEWRRKNGGRRGA